MMRHFRGMAKWIMVVLTVAFVGWMVFDVGMDVTGRGNNGASADIARVNGTRIDQQTFYAALRTAQETQRKRSGSAPTTLEDQKQMENSVLEDLVQQILLRDELARRGIKVTNEEIISAAQNSPPPELEQVPEFQTDGRFDLAKYKRYLAANADPQFLQALEARYRDEIPRLKLFEELASGVYVSTARLWRMYRDQHDSVTARVVAIQPETFISDSVVPLTDDQLRAYYSSHSDDFKRPAYAYLSYVAVPRLANTADSAAARARVDSLHRRITAGADFAALARAESGDSGSATNGGDLGDTKVGQMVPEFERAVLALKPGQVSQPVRSGYGWHIIKLDSRNDKAKTYHARHILIPVELAGAHRDQVESRADSLDRYAAEQTDPATLDSVGRHLGVAVLRAPRVAQGERVSLGRFLIPDAGVWAFGTARPGETSQVIETDNAFYVFRLDSLQAAGIPPFDAVKADVRRTALKVQKWEAVRALAQQLTKEIHTGAKLGQVADRVKLPVQNLGPFTRVNPPVQLITALPVIGAAFGLGVGQTSEPIESKDALYFVEPAYKHLADSSAFAKQVDLQRAQVVQAARQDRVRQVVAALREQAKVVDRRKELEEQARKLEDQAPATPGGLALPY
ncbi:MAG: hypothetical protein EXR93_00590 [Gemmatimonadetes bacterium]|nr:hypothetical protein [Gemmatimonadota bacterium]